MHTQTEYKKEMHSVKFIVFCFLHRKLIIHHVSKYVGPDCSNTSKPFIWLKNWNNTNCQTPIYLSNYLSI